MPLDPYNITPNASINRVKLMSAPGLPDEWRGKTAYQVIGRDGLVQRINMAFPELTALSDCIPAFSQQYLAQEHPSALAIADEMGLALACLLFTLKHGEAANREARPQWDDSYWAHWGSIQHIIFGGGLMAGLLGKYMMAKATGMLSGLMSLTIADYPSALPLIGAARMATDANEVGWVFDFGGTHVKRAQAIYENGSLTRLEQLPSILIPALDQANHVLDFMVQAITTTISTNSENTQSLRIYASLSNYVNDCQLANDTPYGRLNILGANICDVFSKTVSQQMGKQAKVMLVHDGTAAAKAYAGASNTAVITVGTALGMGFPPSAQSVCPLSDDFAIKQLVI